MISRAEQSKIVEEILKKSRAQKKDVDRIEAINSKSGGNHRKALTLANQMANAIKDKAKAKYEASVEINGKDNEITKIFESRMFQLEKQDDSTKGQKYYWSKVDGAYSNPSKIPDELSC